MKSNSIKSVFNLKYERLAKDVKFLLMLVLTLAFTNASNATTYVRAKKLYLGGGEYRESRDEAANAEVQSHCNEYMSECTVVSSREYYYAPYANWYWSADFTYKNKPTGEVFKYSIGSLIGFDCPTQFSVWNIWSETVLCSRSDPPEPPPPPPPGCECKETSPAAESMAPSEEVGNPILPSTGVKQQIETDYRNASGSLVFRRVYRSDTKRWENNYQMSAVNLRAPSPFTEDGPNCVWSASFYTSKTYCFPYAAPGTTNDYSVRRGGGRALYFSSENQLTPNKDVNDRMSISLDANGTANGLNVVNGYTDATEHYDTNGLLLTSTDRMGVTTTFAYSDLNTPQTVAPRAGLLLSVTDGFGKQLLFTYNAFGLVNTMTDPSGGVFAYGYDANKNLTSVTYPDGKVRQYIYNESANTSNTKLPFALTGIIDENGNRFATYQYDFMMTAFSTQHSGGVGKYTLSYPSRNQQANVTDPLGTTRTYNFSNILGVVKLSSIVQPAASGNGWVSNTITYDSNGNISSITNFDGATTAFTYDLTRNLELTRVEGYGKPLARTTSTAWHSSWRLPLKVAEPLRLTTYAYDANGNVLSKTVQATTDTTGAAGFNAVLSGTPQVWTYTYDNFGHVLTAKGPRSSVNTTSTFAYDAEGNLSTQTNAAGHVTTYSNYDSNGRVGRITDPNGLVTDLSYTPRGWLNAITVGGETTSYVYDGVGQVTQTTLPDGSAVYYTYDEAHRLIRVADAQGNSLTYTLDNMGNRISEQSKDPTGALTRQIIRAYDGLSRMKQITGAVQ